MDKQTHFGNYAKGHLPILHRRAKNSFRRPFRRSTGYLYIPAHNTCMDYEGTAVNYIAGTPVSRRERAHVSGPRRLSG